MSSQKSFELADINPQCMGDNISATLYATYDGAEYTNTVASYSVRDYCVNQLGKTEDAELKALLSNDLATRFTFVTDSTDGLTVKVSINGRTQTFDTFADAGDGKYCITFDGIMATEFDDTVTATFYRNGTKLGAAVNYSVNTYICGTQNSTNEQFSALVKALYNYGASAKTYAEK